MPGSGVQLGLFDGLKALLFGQSPAPEPTEAETDDLAHPEGSLVRRLMDVGLPFFPRIVTHRNQQVMLSWTPGKIFRVHEGYAQAPDEVLRAIVRFVTPGTRREQRRSAREVFLAFPVERYAPRPERPAGAPRLRPGDQAMLDRLRLLHGELNRRHFGGELGPITLRLSSRMRRRLGEIRLERGSNRPVHIALSRRHLRRDRWEQVTETMLHEMVHQWQAESGRPVDHGAEFRRVAARVGIEPRAVRREG